MELISAAMLPPSALDLAPLHHDPGLGAPQWFHQPIGFDVCSVVLRVQAVFMTLNRLPHDEASYALPCQSG
jgi:hypothetical protein